MTLLQCSWLFLMCFSLGWRSYQQCNGNMLCFAPDMVINEYVVTPLPRRPPRSPFALMRRGFFLISSVCRRAALFVCLFVSAQLEAAALSARRLRRVKHRLSAVVDSQCFIARIDSVIALLNGAPRAGGRPPGLRSEQAFFFSFCLFS